jgi:hypothetical protein
MWSGNFNYIFVNLLQKSDFQEIKIKEKNPGNKIFLSNF